MSNLARQLERKQTVVSPNHHQQVQQETLKKSRISAGERFLYFTTIIGLVLATYLIISNCASLYIVNKDIQVLEMSINTQMVNNEALQLQVTELSAPDRILKIAQDQLGMSLNDQNVMVVKN